MMRKLNASSNKPKKKKTLPNSVSQSSWHFVALALRFPRAWRPAGAGARVFAVAPVVA
jgi:hypothetical protein